MRGYKINEKVISAKEIKKMIDHETVDTFNLIMKVRRLLPTMTDEFRLDFFDRIFEGYCKYCGSDHLPCYCQKEE